MYSVRRCTLLPVTLRIPSFSVRHLKLEATCAIWSICKHTIFNVWYISWWCLGVRKALDSKRDLQGYSRSLVSIIFDRLHRFSISLLLQLCLYLAPFPIMRCTISYLPKLKKVRLPWTIPFSCNLSRMHYTCTISQCQFAHHVVVLYSRQGHDWGPKIWSILIKNWSCDPDHAHFRGGLSSQADNF